MKLYPAIDLRGGQAVRLYQGDYDRMTVYNADPVAQAQQFIDAGAKYLHVVDLDGAKDDTTANLQTIAAIAKLGASKSRSAAASATRRASNGILTSARTAAFWARWP